MITTLTEALRTEFGGEVTFLPNVPKQITAPAIVVSPGEIFLEPREAASSQIREHWTVLVAVSVKNMAAGLAQMRKNSLRVRQVVNANGGVWLSASGPRVLAGDSTANTETVVSLNNIQFRYDATAITDPPIEDSP